MHNCSTSLYTYLTIHRNRGKKGMDASGVLAEFQGIAVHDCWPHYWEYADATHALCNAHLLRELNAITENKPEQTWAMEMKKLLLHMKMAVDQALTKGQKSLSAYETYHINRRYNGILVLARAQNPTPDIPAGRKGRPKRGKILSLIDRFTKHKASVCLFTKNFAVPFDNNQAERDIRMLKVKTKVSGCFRSQKGANNFATLMSFLGTAKKHKVNCFTAIKLALQGDADALFA